MELQHLPPEYEGTKLGATRTVRDIFHSNEEFNDYLKLKVHEAIQKREKTIAEKARKVMFHFFLLLIFAPVITYLEYAIYKRIFE